MYFSRRVARLIERYGADAKLPDLREVLAGARRRDFNLRALRRALP
jgi:hypothetical protein